MDWSGSMRQTGCPYLFQSIEGENGSDSEITFTYAHTNDMDRIRLAKRSIVQNRYYDRVTKEIHMGELSPNQWDSTPAEYNKPVLRNPFPLRESFVRGISNITGGKPVITKEDSKRTVDVGYFWKNDDYSHYGFYRRDIARVVKTLHHSIEKVTGRLIENTVHNFYNDKKDMEAGHVQLKYIKGLLSCKIVVITQRDEWEDHFRLMESLASGAMIMTDSMVALPEGLVDKVNIVVYDSPKMLKKLIKHYLKAGNERKKIATRGYRLVMGQHRSWHRLEELLFGKPLTGVDQHYHLAPAKEVPPGNA